MNKFLKVHSGNCVKCDVGIPTNLQDASERQLHTGDIVLVWYYLYPGTDIESRKCVGMTAVVCEQYQTFSDGSVEYVGNMTPFVMGIAGVDLDNDPSWEVEIIKKFSDVVDGEHWSAFGFNYAANPEAEGAKLNAQK